MNEFTRREETIAMTVAGIIALLSSLVTTWRLYWTAPSRTSHSLLSHEVAIGLGYGIFALALLMHGTSLALAARSRKKLLDDIRPTAHARPGIQALMILQMSTTSNAGEPGMVLGSTLSGLLVVFVRSDDTDFFLAAVMAGLLIGFCLQWAIRIALGFSLWRKRVDELCNIERPVLSIPLLLDSIGVGNERDFMHSLCSQPVDRAAEYLERLVMAKETQIISAQGMTPFRTPGAWSGKGWIADDFNSEVKLSMKDKDR